MRRYLIDTTSLTALLAARPAAVSLMTPWIQSHELATSILVYGEVIEHLKGIRRALRPPHGKGLIGDIDTLIAATALERRLTVVTTDTDFQRVAGLSVLLLDRRTQAPIPTT